MLFSLKSPKGIYLKAIKLYTVVYSEYLLASPYLGDLSSRCSEEPHS